MARRILTAALVAAALLGAVRPVVRAQAALPTGTWATLAPMPTARQELAVAVLDGKVFVIGGYDTSGASTAVVEVYDPASDTWRAAAPLPLATNHNAAAVVDGVLLAFGGTSPRVFAYSAAHDSWSELTPMRYTHGGTPAVAVIGGKLYVAGGTGPDMAGNELELYDPKARAWQTLAPMGIPRNHTAGGTIHGKFYVVGGRGHPLASTALEVYDPSTRRWSPLAPMPTGRSGIGAGVGGGQLYVFGGEGPRLFGEVEVYDAVTNLWRQLPPMPVPRHGLFAGVIGNAIYLPGGGIRQGLGATTVNTVFKIAP